MNKIRTVTAFVIIALSWIYILGHYFYHAVSGDNFSSKYTTEQPARRGDIFDSRGRLVATSVILYSSRFYTAKSDEQELAHIKRVISRVLGRRRYGRKEIRAFSRNCDHYASVNGDFSFLSGLDLSIHNEIIEELENSKEKIKDLRGKLYYQKSYKRFYPYGESMGPLLGYVGVDGRVPYGIERRFNELLKGHTGEYYKSQVIAAVGGRWGKVNWAKEPKNGDELRLTVNALFQDTAYRMIREAVKTTQAKSGCVILVETKTGRIRAMANYPSFDPNTYSDYEISLLSNPSVSNLYEVGSVMKPLILGFLYDYRDDKGRRILRPTDKFYCENGKYIFTTGNKVRRIDDDKKLQTLDVDHIISYSSNIGMAKIMQRYEEYGDRASLYRYLISILNLKRSINIDIPGYQHGVLKPFNAWVKNYSMISFAIGYEVSAPLINYVMAFNTIPANGRLLRPLLRSSDPVQAYEAHIFSKETAKELQKALELVVEEGTASNIASDKIGFAGKTGTARKWDNEKGKYSKEKYIASFIGYFPKEDPQYTIGVFVDEPRESIYGSSVAAPVFNKLATRVYEMKLGKRNYFLTKAGSENE